MHRAAQARGAAEAVRKVYRCRGSFRRTGSNPGVTVQGGVSKVQGGTSEQHSLGQKTSGMACATARNSSCVKCGHGFVRGGGPPLKQKDNRRPASAVAATSASSPLQRSGDDVASTPAATAGGKHKRRPIGGVGGGRISDNNWNAGGSRLLKFNPDPDDR